MMDDGDQDSESTTMQIEENFLRSCRNGDIGTVKQFLAYRDAGKVEFSVSCKGQTKYLGWTPLHLATYFGHRDVVECLLARNADVNAQNENGDTPLHKAAFIGREASIQQIYESRRFQNELSKKKREKTNRKCLEQNMTLKVENVVHVNISQLENSCFYE